MASPPRSSGGISPPYPQHSSLPSNPRKRPSLSSLQSSHGPKRRKQASIASSTTSAHPLRQTSFPPSEALSGARSPSVESEITTTSRKPRKSRTAKSARSATGDPGSGDDDDGDGDGDGDDDADDNFEHADLQDIEKQGHQRQHMKTLYENMTPDQQERHADFRRFKLRPATVRKIANFTLAQSVPPAIVMSVNAYSKTFVGAIIEGARTVQEEWARAEGKIGWDEAGGALEIGAGWKPDGEGGDGDGVKRRALGPLLPDHIRESLRRWKRDGEANATGLTGRSVGLGLQGTVSARLQGRRLFT